MRFYGSLRGNGRTEATKGGHKGIEGHVRGWSVGVAVRGQANPVTDQDQFTIWATEGSNGGARDVEIGTVTITKEGQRIFVPAFGITRETEIEL